MNVAGMVMPLGEIIDICTGCGACAGICPHQAIIVCENKDGFLRPVVDSQLCTDCGLCEKKCPLIRKVPFDDRLLETPAVYAAYNLDEKIRSQSSSGGIFDILAREILGQGGVVFGAAFDDDFSVSQRSVDSIETLEPLRFSKYVQSHTKDTFAEVKDRLNSGCKVLYAGTPCMIAGLLSFLGKRHDNLFTCSFICGSVPSRKVWRMYREYRDKKAGGKLASVCFRDKRCGWSQYIIKMTFSGGADYISGSDWFMLSFFRKLVLNDCCLSCRFRGVNQLADIMLADFWGIEEYRPGLAADKKGVSAVLVHTAQGQELFKRCSGRMYIEEVPLDLVVRRNSCLLTSLQPHKDRVAFFEDLSRMPIQKIIRKYRQVPTLTDRLKRKVIQLLAKAGLK